MHCRIRSFIRASLWLLPALPLTCASGCGRQGGRHAAGQPSPAPTLTGSVSVELTGTVPNDVASLRIRTCVLAADRCASDVKEDVVKLDRASPTAKETGLAIGPTRFELAILNQSGVDIGDVTLAYTVLPGEQTMPAVTIRLDHRQRLDLTVNVPLGAAAGAWTWADVQPKLDAACGGCHDGSGTLDANKKFSVKAYPLADAAGTPMHDLVADLIRRSGLAADQPGHMPPSGAPFTPHILGKFQLWLDAGMPKDPPSGTPAPPGLAVIGLDAQEMWDDKLVPGVVTVQLPRGAQAFSGAVAVINGAKYRLTYRLLGPNNVLLRDPPDTRDHVVDNAVLTESLDFSGLNAQGSVQIPIAVQP